MLVRHIHQLDQQIKATGSSLWRQFCHRLLHSFSQLLLEDRRLLYWCQRDMGIETADVITEFPILLLHVDHQSLAPTLIIAVDGDFVISPMTQVFNQVRQRQLTNFLAGKAIIVINL